MVNIYICINFSLKLFVNVFLMMHLNMYFLCCLYTGSESGSSSCVEEG